MALSALVQNIAGSEWFIIILLALVLLFGAKRLPQLSRTVGKAVGEYEKARDMFRREMEEASNQAVPKIKGPVATEREKLETIANSLGIDDYAGLSDDELRVLISKRMPR